jgi:hypothetical protein
MQPMSTRFALVALGLALSITGCGSSGPTTNRGQPTGRPPTTASPGSSTTPPVSADKRNTERVSANRTSRATLTQTFRTAGIPEPARWAAIVAAHRPYPTTDPALSALRAQLLRYRPAQDTVDRILAALKLP